MRFPGPPCRSRSAGTRRARKQPRFRQADARRPAVVGRPLGRIRTGSRTGTEVLGLRPAAREQSAREWPGFPCRRSRPQCWGEVAPGPGRGRRERGGAGHTLPAGRAAGAGSDEAQNLEPGRTAPPPATPLPRPLLTKGNAAPTVSPTVTAGRARKGALGAKGQQIGNDTTTNG